MPRAKVPNRRERWREAVLRHRGDGMTGEVRALLLYAAAHWSCKPDATFSIPRREMAEAFNVPEPRISERLRRAVELGLIVSVERGVKGRTAVYQGCVPGYPQTSGWRGNGTSGRTENEPNKVRRDVPQIAEIGYVSPDPNTLGTSGRTHNDPGKGTSGRYAIGSTNFPPLGQVQDHSGSGPEDEISSSKSVECRPRSGRRTAATNNQHIRPISDAEVERDRQLHGLRLLISEEEAS